MPFSENIHIIETAVYGKDMRPAIAEALREANGAIIAMTGWVNDLNARIDGLSGAGSGGWGDTIVGKATFLTE